MNTGQRREHIRATEWCWQCLHSLLAQTRRPDEIIVINNASTDETRLVAERIPHVRVVDEPRKGLVVARETGRLAASGEILVYVDADCRAPLMWLDHVERHFARDPSLIALSAPYKFYDWDWWGRLLIRSWKTLVRAEKQWPAIKQALRANVDVALTLFRKDASAA